ncbi:hypothetical protein ACGYLO_16575 [Sulfitobacter sp. 1A13353]|uniref:hypothetical protein n=1 Tax=Sulfitobacter sp. 1A13353 TaxID=3368568 RepID=UPI003746601E
MPSTYTDRLGLELQADGENLNTWGDKVNTVFELVDEAVGGYAEVAITGDKTLTMDDGASSDARNAVLKLTGAPGAGFALTLPEVEKVWVVWNATDGAATIKTATATATVSLPVNRLALVQSDGAGSVVQVTPLVDESGKVAGEAVLTTLRAAGLTYPASDGAAGQYMKTDGSGNLSFGTPDSGGDMLSTANLSDVASVPDARGNLGLGTAAIKNTGTTSGTVPLIGADGKLPASVLPAGVPILGIIQDQQSAGVFPAKSGASTWETRVLNTVVTDPGSVITLSSNVFSVSVDCSMTFWAASSRAEAQSRVVRVSDGAVVGIGSTQHHSNIDNTLSHGAANLEAGVSYRLEMIQNSPEFYAYPANITGATECYAQVTFWG